MLTFIQFLEGIRDKLGDYSGDPLSVMAARDVAEEDGLPHSEISGWLLKAIFDQIEILKKVIGKKVDHKSTAFSYISYLRNLEESLRSDPIRIDSMKSYLGSFAVLFGKNSNEDPVVIAEFKKLFDLFKKLKNKEVKGHFAGQGSDYELHKLLKQIGNLVHRRGSQFVFHDVEQGILNLKSFLNGEESFDLVNAFGSLAHHLAYNMERIDSSRKRLFVRLVSDKNFMKNLTPVLQSLSRKAASRMHR